MGEEYNKQENLLPDIIISDFIRDYLTLKMGEFLKKDKVYICFKEYYQSLNNYDVRELLEQLKVYPK